MKHPAMSASIAALAGAVSASCAAPAGELEVGRFQIVGGLVARNQELDHTAALVRVERETGAPELLCTATLIAAETALTAKHCAERAAVARALGDSVALAVGFDIASADLVPLVGIAVPAAAADAGALGVGHDLAVLHLDEPVDVRPALARPFDASSARAPVVTLGYGMANAWSAPDGLRRIGRETVVAVSGLVYEILYGDFESYLEVELTGAATDEDYLARVQADPGLADLAALRDEYAGTRLIPDHEIVTRTLDGNTRSCRGDSGGPLLRVSAQGEWEVYGVLSGGPSSLRAECDFGQVWSTLGPVTFAFVEASRGWSDPCGSVGTGGACAGAVIERCDAGQALDERRLVTEACEDGLACRVVMGVARCAAPDAP